MYAIQHPRISRNISKSTFSANIGGPKDLVLEYLDRFRSVSITEAYSDM